MRCAPATCHARFSVAFLGTGLIICALSLACGPSAAAPATPTANPDAFAVVRATSQAAYQAGQTALAQGDYLQACVYLDTAKTDDPDNRSDIQQALDQALAHCLTPVAEPTSPPVAAQQRTVVVATLAAGVGTVLAGTPQAAATGVQLSSAATAQTPIAAVTPAPTATSV